MSREEAEAEDSKKKSDDMRLQMAIAKSKEEDDKAQQVEVHNNFTCQTIISCCFTKHLLLLLLSKTQ